MSMVSSPSAIQLALSEEPSESPPSRRHRRRVKASWWDYPRSVNWSGIQILPQPSFVRKIRRFEIHCPPPWQLPVPPPLASPCSHPRPMLGNSAQIFFVQHTRNCCNLSSQLSVLKGTYTRKRSLFRFKYNFFTAST